MSNTIDKILAKMVNVNSENGTSFKDFDCIESVISASLGDKMNELSEDELEFCVLAVNRVINSDGQSIAAVVSEYNERFSS